jgi:3'(2'), 5'-bisphosphate nucleotidase
LITLADLAQSAGAAVMRIYAQDFEVRRKSDDSPVTEADEAAERLILEGLKKLTPEIPVVSEEASEAGHRPDRKVLRFWLVDPLDGTKEFVKRSGEFTVNIALVEGGMPVMGVVFAPAVNQMFIGGAGGAWKRDDDGSWRRIACRSVPAEGLTIMASRSHGDPEKIAAYLKGRKIAHQVNSGSSLKICRIAEGVADVYPRFGPTSEWDTAAGHAVLLGAGGRIETLDGQPLRYGKDSILNPDFVAWGLGG